MNINCIICSDLYAPASEIYSTICGHIFHFTCLVQWMERSKTCPQCRCRITKTSIHRVYFNLINTEGIHEDATTLQCKVDTLQFQISLKEKDIKIYTDKYNNAKEQNSGLRNEVRDLESKITTLNSAMHALKEQVHYFKVKSKECERLNAEITRMKEKIRDLEHIQTAINGSREQVNDMLRHNRDSHSLSLLVITLKKELIEADRKHKLTLKNMKHIQNDVIRYRKDVSALKEENNRIKNDLESGTLEIQHFKEKLFEMEKKLQIAASCTPDKRLNRIVTENPAHFRAYSCINLNSNEINFEDSPSVAEKVTTIMESDSPYLTLKSSNVGLACLVNPKFTTVSQPSQRNPNPKLNIFKPEQLKIDDAKASKSDYSYDGLGGHSKDETFPKPIIGQKRHKPMTTISSTKFRKLAPNKKLNEYFTSNSCE